MTERKRATQKAQEFFEDLWKGGDYWDFEASDYEHSRCLHLLRMIEGKRYARLLEIGCGAGFLTRLLAPYADRIVALDISQTAIDRARALGGGPTAVDFRVMNIMDYKPETEGPWDLIVFSDTICYLGWLYPFFDVAWLAVQLFQATRSGGRLLMANSMTEGEDWLLRPWLIRTYRDLFVNVGYNVEAENIFKGNKKGVDFEVLVTLYTKPSQGIPPGRDS
ncbi:MAG TPA: class I SAM-dependent methyltransferase [Alphaproteobacteria bacterium]|nr:class I SAM-dependent methyltransferase [Alphaproteobacteria bacterium]